MLNLLAWFFLNFFLFFNIYFLSILLIKNKFIRVFSFFLLGITQIIVSQLILAIFGHYTRLNIYIFNLVLVLSTSIYILKFQGKELKSHLSSFKEIKKLKLLASKFSFIDKLLISLMVLIVAWVGFVGLIFPVTDYDGNSYHMTTVANLIQERSINDVSTSLGWLNGYPKYGELMQAWAFMTVGNDILADTVQIIFVILGVFSIYTLSTTLGISRKNAIVSSTLFLSIPVVINQLKTTYVDVMLASIFFTSLAIISLKYKNIRYKIFLIGICYGILLSLKFTGIIFVITSLGYFLIIEKDRYFNLKLKASLAIKDISIMMIGIIPSLYWYIKNLYLYATPIYPFGFKILGFSIFPGKTFNEFSDVAVSTVSYLPKGYFSRIWFVWTEQRDWYGCLYNYDTNFAGFGPIWFIFLVPSIVFTLYSSIKEKNIKILILFGLFTVLYLVYPSNYYSRYTLFITSLGLISFGYILNRLKKNNVKHIIMLLLLITVISTMLGNISMCNFSPSTFKDGIKNFIERDYRGSKNYESIIGASYKYIQNNANKGDVVIYDSSPVYIYPLWNEEISNKVIYVESVNKEEWLKKVEKLSPKYIFTVKGSKEYNWIINESNLFKSTYEDDIYKVFTYEK